LIAIWTSYKFRGSTSPYLEAASGKASFSLLKMARPGLALHLRKAIRQIKENMRPYTGSANIKLGDATQTITLHAMPLSNGDDSEPYILIVFGDGPNGSGAGINQAAITGLQPGTMKTDAKDHQISSA